jgi:hypothetical protein
LGERGVRNAEVEGSTPLPSTILKVRHLRVTRSELWRGVAELGRERPGERTPLRSAFRVSKGDAHEGHGRRLEPDDVPLAGVV